MKTYNIKEVIDKCLTDKQYWENFYKQYPAIYHTKTETAYVPIGSPVDNMFIKSIIDDDNYQFTTELSDSIPRFTIITDPLIRFCISFRYTDNNIYYNQTGHPRGYFMSGAQVTQSVMSSDHWINVTQSELIDRYNISEFYTYNNLWHNQFNNSIFENLWNQIHNCREHWHVMYWSQRIWEWGKKYNNALTRHKYLEESTHYNIIINSQLKQQALMYFEKEYQIFNDVFNIADAFDNRYDQYWLNLELQHVQ